jgi:hypothetical protein
MFCHSDRNLIQALKNRKGNFKNMHTICSSIPTKNQTPKEKSHKMCVRSLHVILKTLLRGIHDDLKKANERICHVYKQKTMLQK